MELKIKHTEIAPTKPCRDLDEAMYMYHAQRLNEQYLRDILQAVLDDPRPDVLHDARIILDNMDPV